MHSDGMKRKAYHRCIDSRSVTSLRPTPVCGRRSDPAPFVAVNLGCTEGACALRRPTPDELP